MTRAKKMYVEAVDEASFYAGATGASHAMMLSGADLTKLPATVGVLALTLAADASCRTTRRK